MRNSGFSRLLPLPVILGATLFAASAHAEAGPGDVLGAATTVAVSAAEATATALLPKAPIPYAATKAPAAAPPAEIARHLDDAAAAYVIDRNLLESVAWRESRFRQGAKSGKGAAGVMQLMPGTAKDLGVNRNDARENIFGGAAYLKQLLVQFGGDVSLALAAYNAGPGNVLRYGGVPPFKETRSYVAAITARVSQMAAQVTGQAAPAVGLPTAAARVFAAAQGRDNAGL